MTTVANISGEKKPKGEIVDAMVQRGLLPRLLGKAGAD